MRSALIYIALIGAIFIYTTSGVFSKLASQQDFASLLYIAFFCGITLNARQLFAE